MSSNSQHDNRFDILRLLAALLVLWSHCYPLVGRAQDEPLARWTGIDTLGGLGVAIFFVLSGYLITLSWERQPRLAGFARNRALRIYPALLALCLVSVFVVGPWMTRLNWGDYFQHEMTWGYFRNATAWTVAYPLPGVFEANPVPSAVNGSLWSLPYEVRCYLVLALLAMLPLPLQYKALAVLLGLSALQLTRPGSIGVFDRFVGLDYFHIKLGIFFAVGANWACWRHQLHRHASLAVGLALPLLAYWWAGPARMLLIWCGVASLFVWLALNARWLPRLPQRWGDWSYGAYLYGFPVQQVLVALGLHALTFSGFVAASTGLTLGLGALSWHLIEKHAIRWKHRA
jgi:peptidoglycan/LPS O-acetylase OafA/YrhL